VTEQLESILKIAGDVTQKVNIFDRRENYFLFMVFGRGEFLLLLIKG